MILRPFGLPGRAIPRITGAEFFERMCSEMQVHHSSFNIPGEIFDFYSAEVQLNLKVAKDNKFTDIIITGTFGPDEHVISKRLGSVLQNVSHTEIRRAFQKILLELSELMLRKGFSMYLFHGKEEVRRYVGFTSMYKASSFWWTIIKEQESTNIDTYTHGILLDCSNLKEYPLTLSDIKQSKYYDAKGVLTAQGGAL